MKVTRGNKITQPRIRAIVYYNSSAYKDYLNREFSVSEFEYFVSAPEEDKKRLITQWTKGRVGFLHSIELGNTVWVEGGEEYEVVISND